MRLSAEREGETGDEVGEETGETGKGLPGHDREFGFYFKCDGGFYPKCNGIS